MIAMTVRRSFIAGALIGCGGTVLALSLEIVDVFLPPVWQQIAFYPGFEAGWGFINCCRQWFGDSSVTVAMLIGVMTVAVWYGIVGLTVRWIVLRVANRRAGAAGGAVTETPPN
jgi:hypothetical protein